VLDYTGDPVYDGALLAAFAFAAVTAVAALFVKTPYGRFADDRFGIALDPRLGWLLMELPAPVVFVWCYLQGPMRGEPFALFVLFVWLVHYANRGFVMPALMRVPRGQATSFSLFVVAAGWLATALHGYLNGTFTSSFSPASGAGWSWFADPRFVLGVVVYYTALVLNVRCDATLRNLRTREEVEQGVKSYRVPRGGLFEYVSSPSYLTELVAWAGFALFTWSWAGVYILALSAANLVPRSAATHRWYVERFPDYPAARRILIPFVW